MPLKFFVCFYKWSEKEKTMLRSFDVDSYWRRQIWRGVWVPQVLLKSEGLPSLMGSFMSGKVFWAWWSSKSLMISSTFWKLSFSSNPMCWLLVDLSSYLLPYYFKLLLCFWCFNTCSILWGIYSMILYTWKNISIFNCSSIFVIIETSEELYKTVLVPKISPFLMMKNTSIWNNCC